MGSKGSMPMELLPASLSSSSTICLYELLHRAVWSGGLVDWYVVLSLAVGLVHVVYVLVIPFIVEVQQSLSIFLANVLALLVGVMMG